MTFSLLRDAQGRTPKSPIILDVTREPRSEYSHSCLCREVYRVTDVKPLVEQRLVLATQNGPVFVCDCLGAVVETPPKPASEPFGDVVANHLSTWGSNCGAPRSVYEGHINSLLKAHAEYIRTDGGWREHPSQHALDCGARMGQGCDCGLPTLNLTRSLVVIDLEGTSLDVAESRIVEFACTVLNPDGTRKRFSQRFNPGIPIPPSATEVHGISDIDVAGCPPFREFAVKIQKGLEGKDIGGYNLRSYDLPVLESEYARIGMGFSIAGSSIIDVFGVYQKLDPRDLSAAVRKYCGRQLEGAHGAQADCDATLDVLKGQIAIHSELAGMSVEELAKFSVRGDIEPVDIAGKLGRNAEGALVYLFGKHRGQTVQSESGFAIWMIGKDFAESTKDVLRGELNRLGL